ncbi:MAG TPA: DUF72 domain-containing protein [Gaiellaceae bacterium]|jgi:uncharacterized protein YecE (DUF72 family)
MTLHVGTSGWSYPTWRGGFYPADAKPDTFLRHYAERFDTVELNTTGYRLPAEEQFRRWAEQTPAGFTFAPKLPLYRIGGVGTFVERVSLLGPRLGPLRVHMQQQRDEGLLALLLGSVDAAVRIALDFRHPSWEGIELPHEVAVVNDLDRDSAFRYVRLREPPYSEADLRELAARLRGGPESWVYFRHEDEPTAPAYASRLSELLQDR